MATQRLPATPEPTVPPKRGTVLPVWVRITHWLSALAIVGMTMSGWQVYNASPLFHALVFPSSITLGSWLGGALQWHFAAMWLLAASFGIYLVLNILSGRLFRRFGHLRPSALLADIRAALTLRLGHADLTEYNAIQKLAYLLIMLDLCLLVMSGLVLWKSVQFPVLRTLLGGYDSARYVHFGAMTFLVCFVIVHLAMVLLVPRTLVMMVIGRLPRSSRSPHASSSSDSIR